LYELMVIPLHIVFQFFMIDGFCHKIQHNLFRTSFAHHIAYIPLDDSDVRCCEKVAQFTGLLYFSKSIYAISFKGFFNAERVTPEKQPDSFGSGSRH
jgi:hypothetical protein